MTNDPGAEDRKNLHRGSSLDGFLEEGILDDAASATGPRFRATVCQAARQDPQFRRRLLTRGFALAHSADADDRAVGLSHLRACITTMGFESLAQALGRQPRSLPRMLEARRHPRLGSFAALVDDLLSYEGISLDQVPACTALPQARATNASTSSRISRRRARSSAARSGRQRRVR